MAPSLRLVAGLLWGSGFCALFYQTAWQRMFRLSFGASTAASAAVLAIFLGGLGVGGLVLGRRAQQHERPLALYGNLELGVAAAAAVSPFLADALGRIYIGLGGVSVLGQPAATLVRLLITAIVVGPAAFFMGGTLPAAARAVETEGDRARSRLALLYGMNTLGAVTGALAGTFFMFELLGIRFSLWAAVLVNVLVGIVARSVGREAEEVRDAPTTSAPTASARAAAVLGSLVAGFVGFAFLLLEIVWYRLLAPILGGTTYTFGLVLAVALAGIGLGGYLYSLRDSSRPVTPSDLAVVTAIEGVFVALPIALGDRIALYAIATRYLSSLGFVALVFVWMSITAVVVFPAALVSGYQFPLLFALLGSGRDRVARHIGTVYAFNTAGALLGSLLGGFVLIPWLTVVGCYRLVAVLLLALALVSVAFDWFNGFTAPSEASRGTEGPLRGRFGRRRNSLQVVALVALGGVLTAQIGPTAVFRHLPIGAGRVAFPGRTVNELRLWSGIQNAAVLWQSDGVETSVALTTSGQLAFIVDGKSDGAVYTDRATQSGLGLIGALMHPAPKRALVIGLGTGMTAGYLSAVPTMERVDVAELEPSILHVARVAAKANLDVLSRRNVTVHLGDGRELVLAAKGLYDVIASEPSNPYRAGVASLYTKEFYQAAAAHLAQDGVFLQWVQAYETDALTLQIVARTLSSALPSVEAWQTEPGDVLFIASKHHRVIDANALRRRIAKEPFRSAFPRTLLINDLEGLLGRYLASDALLSELVREPGVEINTDDQNLIEYAFARGVGSGAGSVPQRLMALAAKRRQDRPDVVGAVDWERVAELRPRAWLISGDAPQLSMPSEAAQARSVAVGVGCRGNYAGALRTWEAGSGVGPRDDVEVYVLGMALSEGGDERAATYADRLAAGGFTAEANLVRARSAVAKGDMTTARTAASAAVIAMHDTPFPLCSAAEVLIALVKELAQAKPEYRRQLALELMTPFAVYTAEDHRIAAAQFIAETSGDPALCVSALGARLDHPPWAEEFLALRLRCLSAAGRPEAARAAADLAEYRRFTPGVFAAEQHQ